MVHDPDIGGAQSAEGLLKLCRRAGYSEDEAQKMATERANQRLDKELVP